MTDVAAVAQKLVGWLEESPGVKSSSRLFAAVLIGTTVVFVLVAGWYMVYFALHHLPIDGQVLLGVAAVITAILAPCSVVMAKRGDGS